MIWIIKRSILILLLTGFSSGTSLIKIALNSGQEFQNCEFQALYGDTLTALLQAENSARIIEKAFLIQNINFIVASQNSHVTKYFLSKMSPVEKVETLTGIFLHNNNLLTPVNPNIIDEYQTDQGKSILIPLFILTAIVIIIVILYGFIKKKNTTAIGEKIPGVKEMAKTIIFRAKKHREKISKY